MARVRKIFADTRGSRPHPTEVDCGYQVILQVGGSKLFQISTYGSDQRESEPKVSQTIQLDAKTASELVKLIETAFAS